MFFGCSNAARYQSRNAIPALAPRIDALPFPAAQGALFSHWDYHFDRNAIVASVSVGSSLIAIVEAGHILKFDKSTFAITGEHISTRMAVALALAPDGRVIVSFKSGQIARLDESTLVLETIGAVPGVPVWIGYAPDGELVVMYGRRGLTSSGYCRSELSAYRVRWMKSGHEVRVSDATAFLRDSAGHLWLGADHGEWGGGLQVVDLGTQIVHTFAKFDNVYGFAEPQPGAVWTTGGVIHMGLLESFIKHVKPDGTSRQLYYNEGISAFGDATSRRWLSKSQPHYPITHVIQLPTGKLVVFAYSEVFETDQTLRSFRKIARLSLDGPSGRPDAVGWYPPLRSVHIDPNGIVLATARDGFVSLDGETLTLHAVQGQLIANSNYFSASKEGFMVFGSPSSLWSPTGWKSIAHFDERKRSEGSTLLPTGDQTLVESMRAQSIARRKSPDPKLGEYNRIDGLNNAVQYVQIDPQGRTWLAGGGLWYLDKDRRAIPVHPHLPFMADTKVEDFAVADNHLVLALGSRGLAILDLANLSEVTPTAQLPAIANWDRPQAHEPNSTDGAVFVSQVCPPVGSCQDKQPSDEVRKKLQDAVEETTIPSFALETYTYRGKIRGFVLAGFGSPDPEALARLFIGVLRDEPLRSSLVVFLRRGPLGTRLEEIEAAAGGMH